MSGTSLKSIIYCSECYHVYFKIPESNRCAICDNEIIAENHVHSLDFLTCETCHSVFTIQNLDEIIPKNIENPNYLCSCKYNCPTSSLLEVALQETFLGNIVLAEIKQCSNCGALIVANKENHQKRCLICESRFVHAINWNVEYQKLIFSCANPQHQIRLKIRDLIEFVNHEIFEKISIIKEREKSLQNTYDLQRKNIIQKYDQKKLGEKVKQKIIQIKSKKMETQSDELLKLNSWALKERRLLYSSLNPIPLRCVVYKQKNDANLILIKTTQGCNALAKLRIVEIIKASDGTVLEKPVKKETSIAEIKDQSHKIQREQSTMNWRDSTISLINDANESIFTQILRPSKEINQEALSKESSFINTDQRYSRFSDLPVLNLEQIYIVILILDLSNKDDNHILNYGVIPLNFSNDIIHLLIGREHFLRAFWKNASFFIDYPLIFENIISIKEGGHFVLTKQDPNEIIIKPKSKFTVSKEWSVFKPTLSNVTFQKEIVPFSFKDPFFIPVFYPLRGQSQKKHHSFVFELKIIKK